MRKILSVFLLSTLAACAQPNGSGEQSVTFTNESGKNFVAAQIPVPVQITRAEPTAATSQPSTKKVPGTCVITEARYKVSTAVPGTVNLPAYSQGAQPINVTCTFEGKTKQVRLQPENLSRVSRQTSNVGLAILCPICGLGAAIGTSAKGANREGDVYGFRKIEIEADAS